MKSMTGFAQGRFTRGDFSLFVSFKSYNNRYLEINFKGSGISAASEKFIKEMLKDRLQRGKIEIVYDLFQNNPKNWDIRLNSALLDAIISKIMPLKEKFGPSLNLSLDGLLKLPMVFHLDTDPDRLDPNDQAFIKRSIAKVFKDFLSSRSQEGVFIGKDLLDSVALIESHVKVIAAKEKDFEKEMFINFQKRIAKYVHGLHIDEKRIAQEAAISAEKTSIAEEINRLKTHSQRLKTLLKDTHGVTIGREADFLSQEMQRETHTIAAKTNCLDIHQHILIIRREIEKIRQQVQNIE
ncbi:MAG TPA: YicC/YloC family endoribonuclease [Candidatus Binatia bacterium]|nr:YicC/YloC family endoribonuclease [Candidatus Binatia bacterium]